MDKTQLLALAQKYMEGTASEEEIQQLHAWYDGANDDEIEMVFTNRRETQHEMGRRLYAGLQEKMQGRGRECCSQCGTNFSISRHSPNFPQGKL